MKIAGEEKDDEKDSDCVVSTIKVNAFQFMMNSRNRVIGRNSFGKDADAESSPESFDKTDLKSQKNFLESWAQLKGASKRKRDYEEKGNMINYKLEKRAKRLKKLLKFGSQDSDEDEIIIRKKYTQVIESDDEDSQVSDQKGNKSDGNNTEEFHEATDENVHNRMVLGTLKSKLKFKNVLSESNEEGPSINKKTLLKVAPVFSRSVPKPKRDTEVTEARRKFLLSGVPSSLKKEMEKHQSFEEADFEVFPLISHIQQKTLDNTFWNLPKVDLQNLMNYNKPPNIEVNSFILSALPEEIVTESIKYDFIISNRFRSHKKIVKYIKSKNPSYPVYRIFNSLYKRSGYKIENIENKPEIDKPEVKVSTAKRKGRKKKNSCDKNVRAVDQEPPGKSEEEFSGSVMWTEKYKAVTSSDIIGNHESVASLKEWLTNWLNTPNEEKKIRKTYYDSESEFECTDDDNRGSMKVFGNTLVLQGPVGCGKTTAVYAVCRELGLNVLEMNASGKRTGKRLFQELHEATQSHQVRKKESLLTLFRKEIEKASEPKMCVLLVEDVDIVFEQDEGFYAALTQIITTSKRPLILTTNDENAPTIQKLITYSQTISFLPLTSLLAIWLQVVCLIEGCYVNVNSLKELLEYNNGDVRRTLLHMQFFVTSGGSYKEFFKDKSEVIGAVVTDSDLIDEDDSNMSDCRINGINESAKDVPFHHVCISNFEAFKRHKLFSLPCYVSLNKIWWNLPRICHLPDFSGLRLDPNNSSHPVKGMEKMNKAKEKQKLCDLLKIYDTLAFSDAISDKNNYEDLEKTWYSKSKDSLTLNENMNMYSDIDFINDLSHTLLSTSIKLYKEEHYNAYTAINMVLPSTAERKWLSRQFSSADKLKEAILLSNCLERSAIELDYMSALRTIARFELRRAENNNKRGGRFYNYFRNLGVKSGDSAYKAVCEVFKIRD